VLVRSSGLLDFLNDLDSASDELVIPVVVTRVFLATEALGRFVLFAALGAVSRCLKGVPAMAAVAEPGGIGLRFPRTLGTVNEDFA
jgi:hypothetical protein